MGCLVRVGLATDAAEGRVCPQKLLCPEFEVFFFPDGSFP